MVKASVSSRWAAGLALVLLGCGGLCSPRSAEAVGTWEPWVREYTIRGAMYGYQMAFRESPGDEDARLGYEYAWMAEYYADYGVIYYLPYMRAGRLDSASYRSIWWQQVVASYYALYYSTRAYDGPETPNAYQTAAYSYAAYVWGLVVLSEIP